MPEKEYGKLSEDQFKRLVRSLPEIRKESKRAEEVMRAASKEKLREVLGDGISWSSVYEVSLAEGTAHLILALGYADRLLANARLPDPQEAMLRDFESDEDLPWDGGTGGQYTKGDVVGLATAMQRNILGIMMYKRSLSSLVAQARDDGDDSALFNAIRIDRSIVACPTAAKRISKAELLGEKLFFIRLRSALKGPSRKHWEGYQDLRYSLALLRELGFDQMSDAQLEHLLVDVLKVYPKSYAARKNLRKQYYESKKIKTL